VVVSGPAARTSVPDQAARSPGGRPRQPDADRAILQSAFRLLVDRGYPSTSIEAVAADAGVAKTTIYRRYPTKRELAIAALRDATSFEPRMPPDLDSRTALAMFVREGINGIVGSGAFRVLGSLLTEDRREPGLMDEFRRQLIEPRQQLVIQMLERGVARGELRSDIDAALVTELVAGAVLAHHVILGQPRSQAWADSLVDAVWELIRAR
jgi:AcrR family transcriptional regulator